MRDAIGYGECNKASSIQGSCSKMDVLRARLTGINAGRLRASIALLRVISVFSLLC